MGELISRREFARRAGVSETAIRKAIKEGRLALTDGKLHYESAIEDWERTRGPGNNNRFGELDGDSAGDYQEKTELFGSYQAEKTRLTAAQAEKAELEVQVMRGELHHAEDVEAVLNHMVAAFRSRTLAIPNKAAGELLNLQSLGEIQAILTRHVHEALAELSTYDPARFAEEGQKAKRRIVPRSEGGGQSPPGRRGPGDSANRTTKPEDSKKNRKAIPKDRGKGRTATSADGV